MNYEPLKILAINSMPAYGNAGLKCILSILGTHAIPVPSLILSGLGNISGFQKFHYDFRANLKSTLKHVADFQEKIVLYVGYLGTAEQIEIILEQIHESAYLIKAIVIDPVCGDHGMAYVDGAIIQRWPLLLEVADWATPNVTEVSLLTGAPSIEEGIQQLRDTYPPCNWIVTSYPTKEHSISNHLITSDGLVKNYCHARYPQMVSGAGDTFTSFFISEYFLSLKKPEEALIAASKQTAGFLSKELVQRQ